MTPLKGMQTPWDRAQSVREIATGIWRVDTAGHGGYWLSPARLQELRRLIPVLDSKYCPAPWFEEDCEWAAVALVFPAEFSKGTTLTADEIAADARKTFERFYPKALAAFDAKKERAA